MFYLWATGSGYCCTKPKRYINLRGFTYLLYLDCMSPSNAIGADCLSGVEVCAAGKMASGGVEVESPVKQCITVLEKKIRNLEKRKVSDRREHQSSVSSDKHTGRPPTTKNSHSVTYLDTIAILTIFHHLSWKSFHFVREFCDFSRLLR